MTELSYPSVLAAYAEQSWCIDHGDAAGWAHTFTEDGAFISPSYPRTFRGRPDLEAFAADFHRQAQRDGVVRHHVVTNVVPPRSEGSDTVTRATLQIIEQPASDTARVLRVVDIEDSWDFRDQPLIRTRRVSRGDEQ